MYTSKFSRLPSDTGVTFKGVEKISIPSREEVAQKLSNFLYYCLKEANKPAIRAILGEWGEGKTDTFRRYIEPKVKKEHGLAFCISASTLLNSYKSERVRSIMETTPLSALKLLVAILNSIKHETKEKKIPDISLFKSAEEYVNKSFEKLCGKEKLKLFIFIDEFEELLLYSSQLKEITSGIKEIINGMYEPIDEEGEYEGCFHLIIAVTPDAFYKLQTDKDISLIFGGLGRRTGTIELPEITKKEAIKFLIDLLSFCYNEKLPEPLPFENLGIFHAIYRITMGNLGNMVSLFTKLLVSAVENDKVKVIDPEHFLKFLEKTKIFVYGAATPCLESNRLNRMIVIVENTKLGKNCSILLKKLISEPIPFKRDELGHAVNYKKVHELISAINTQLKRHEQIGCAILKVAKVKKRKTADDIVNKLKEYIIEQRDQKYIKIDNYIETVDNFKNRISFYGIIDGQVKEYYILPIESSSVLSFFEGISQDRSNELSRKFRKLCENEPYYLISEEILRQVYPTPIPSELEFIKDREHRMKLWREVTRKLSEEFDKNILDAFKWLISEAKFMHIEEEKSKNHWMLCNFEYNGLKGKSILYSVNGDVEGNDIEEIHRLIRQFKPIHCVFLIYTGEITENALDKIEEKGFDEKGDDIIFKINLHPTLTKRMICCYKSQFIKEEEIDNNILKKVIRKTVYEDLDFERKFKDWLSFQEEKGVVIKGIKADYTTNLRELADTLKFFINYIDLKQKPERIFEENQKLIKFVKYESKKVSLIPDIQLPKFLNLTKDLENNKFLKRSNRFYKVVKHPVEKRILQIFEQKGEIDFSTLKTFFILGHPKVLEDVFLHILEYKGLIFKEGKYYKKRDATELWRSVENTIKRLDTILKRPDERRYGYFLVSKEREFRFIKLDEFSELIKKIYSEAEKFKGFNEEIELQKLSLTEKLLNHFFSEFYPLLKKAYDKSNNIFLQIENKISDIKENFKEIREKCKSILRLDFKTVEDFHRLENEYKSLKKLKEYKDKEISDFIKTYKKNSDFIRKFYFRNEEKKAYYFNVKYYLIKDKSDKILNEISKCEEKIEKILEEFRSIEQKIIETKNKIKKVENNICPHCKISKSIIKLLDKFSSNVLREVEASEFEKIALEEIKDFVRTNKSKIEENLKEIEKNLVILEKISNEEANFIQAKSSASKLVNKLRVIFDTKESKEYLKRIEKVLKNIDKNYNTLIFPKGNKFTNLVEVSGNIENRFRNFISEINDAKKDVETFWKTYKNEIQGFNTQMRSIIVLFEERYHLDFSNIKSKLSKMNEIIKLKLNELSVPLSSIEKLKQEIKKEIYEKVKNVIRPTEYNVLQFLTKKIRESKWISTEELEIGAIEELNIDREKLNDALENLIKLKLIKKGVTLAM